MITAGDLLVLGLCIAFVLTAASAVIYGVRLLGIGG